MSRLAIDIGGTFTDLVYYDEKTAEITIGKVSTTPKDQAEGVVQSIKKAGVELVNCRFLIHGTTIVINAVLERKGAKTALIATKGFKDVVHDRQSKSTRYVPTLPIESRNRLYKIVDI